MYARARSLWAPSQGYSWHWNALCNEIKGAVLI